MRGPAALARSWWGLARAAGPGRLTYEIALAVALSAVTGGLSLVLHQPSPGVVAGLAVLDLALVGLRRRFPATVLIVAAALGTLLGSADVVLLFGLGFAAGYRIPGPGRLAATLAAVLAAQVAGGWFSARAITVPQSLFVVGVFVVVTLFPATLARLSAQRRRILTLMHERTLHLREQQQIIAERARIREANRIAREMHDSLGHRLTLISLYTGVPRSASEWSDERLQLLHAMSTSAMDELRHILTVLRDEPSGDEPRQRATLADIEGLVTDARSAGARIELDSSGKAVAVPAMIDQAAYRTLQEGITNALRHARGGVINAAVRYEDDALIAEVVNGPGRPYDGVTTGQGLYGLAERVRIAGGVLYHGAEPDGGFRVAATLPLTSVAPRAAEPRAAEPAVPGRPAVPDEYGEELRRIDQRRRAWTVGAGLGVVLALGLCAGGVWIAVRQQTVSRATYDELRTGDPAAGVRRKLPDPSARLDPARVVPPAPPGADCVAYRSAPRIGNAVREKGYRFCFRAGTLISKETLDDVG
jgi:signal transduction histidine kinase